MQIESSAFSTFQALLFRLQKGQGLATLHKLDNPDWMCGCDHPLTRIAKHRQSSNVTALLALPIAIISMKTAPSV